MVGRLLEEAEKEAFSGGISRATADSLSKLKGADVVALAAVAARVRQSFRTGFDLCALVNAKSGHCGEDCAFCAQSAHYRTGVQEYPLLDGETVVACAEEAVGLGAQRFCIVTSGRRLSDEEFRKVTEMLELIKKRLPQLLLDASLGELDWKRAERLKKAGVSRYNHNIETAPSFYPRICSTHDFKERLRTAKCVKDAGMELCCGGIIGMGEDWGHRIEMAFALKELEPDCVPINLLIPQKGTPLEGRGKTSVVDAIKSVSIMRLILPKATVKVAGGRETCLGDFQGFALLAGADGIIIGGYLTTEGRSAEDDLRMLEQAGEFFGDVGE